MEPLATVDQATTLWPTLADAHRDRVELMLHSASTWVRIWYPTIPAQPGEPLATALMGVVSSMVRRSLLSEQRDSEGLTQQAESADGFSRSVGYSNPDGNVYLTAQERHTIEAALEHLGLGRRTAVSMTAEGL